MKFGKKIKQTLKTKNDVKNLFVMKNTYKIK